MSQIQKKVSIMCFHDELCQVYNALMTALSLLRNGADVTIFFGSRGVNAVHKDKVKDL
jgi:peroxiredoxin family protein